MDLLTVAHNRRQRREVAPLAMLIQIMCNVHRDSQQRLQPFELEEVLGWLGFPPEPEREIVEPPRPTPEELRQKLEWLSQMFPPQNGKG